MLQSIGRLPEYRCVTWQHCDRFDLGLHVLSRHRLDAEKAVVPTGLEAVCVSVEAKRHQPFPEGDGCWAAESFGESDCLAMRSLNRRAVLSDSKRAHAHARRRGLALCSDLLNRLHHLRVADEHFVHLVDVQRVDEAVGQCGDVCAASCAFAFEQSALAEELAGCQLSQLLHICSEVEIHHDLAILDDVLRRLFEQEGKS